MLSSISTHFQKSDCDYKKNYKTNERRHPTLGLTVLVVARKPSYKKSKISFLLAKGVLSSHYAYYTAIHLGDAYLDTFLYIEISVIANPYYSLIKIQESDSFILT